MSSSHEPTKKQLDEWSVEAQRELAEGSPDRACELFRRLIEVWTRLHGPDHERVLAFRGFLGRALTEARRYGEAEEVLSDLLVDRVRVEGLEASGTLAVRGNLCRAIALGGRPQEAIVLAQHLLEDRTRLFGAEHPTTLNTRGHIAHFHYLAGMADEAVQLYEELLVDRERLLGPSHPSVAATEENLSAIRAKVTGSWTDLDDLRGLAEALLEDLGPDHPETIGRHALLAERLIEAGRHAEALSYCNWICDARARLLGERNLLTVSARTLRASCLVGVGRALEARQELERLVARLDDMGLRCDAMSLHARADLLDLSMAMLVDAGTVFELWSGLYEDSRHLEPGNELREWIDAQGARFEHPVDDVDGDEDDEHDDEDALDLAARSPHHADPRHYRTAYVVMPTLVFGEMGPAVILGLLNGVGPVLMAAMWQQASGEPIDRTQFSVETRRSDQGACVVVIGMPSTGAPPEAAYLGLYVPAALVDLLDRHAAEDAKPDFARDLTTTMGVRLFSLEHALLGTMIGEVRVGRHLNLGLGPDPSVEAMFAVVDAVIGEEL